MAFPTTPLDLQVALEIDGNIEPITDRLLAEDVTLTVGGNGESTRPAPATVTCKFKNHDGLLTPHDPRSPWWPWLDTGSRFLIGIGDPEWHFLEVSEIVPYWPDGDVSDDDVDVFDLPNEDELDTGEAFVAITASGILRRLGKKTGQAESALVRNVTRTWVDDVFDYWPMEDEEGAPGAVSGMPSGRYLDVGELPLMDTIGFTLASDTTLPGSKPLPAVRSGADASWHTHVSPTTEGSLDGFWNAEWFMHAPEGPREADASIRFHIATTGTIRKWTIAMGFEGTVPFVRVRSYDIGGTIVADELQLNPQDMFDEGWSRMRLHVEQVDGNVVWDFKWGPIGNDGLEDGYTLSGSDAGGTGAPTWLACDVHKAPAGGFSCGHIILHAVVTDIDWLGASADGYTGELAHSRWVRLTGQDGFGGSYFSAFGDDRRMGPQKALPLIELLYEIAEADQGILRESIGGSGIDIVGRTAIYNVDPDLTLNAAASDIDVPFSPVADVVLVANDVTASRTAGGRARLIDQDDIDDRGGAIFPLEFAVNCETEADARYYAGWQLHLGTWRGMRYPVVTIDLGKRPDLIDSVQFLRIGDILRLENLPPQHPVGMGDVDLIIQGWSDTFGRFTWTREFNCTPHGPWRVGEWEVDRWSPRAATLTAGIDDNDTSFQVTNSGIIWTTDDAHFPFDVILGGCERATVTDISGGSSPQTFTVTRNVNGLVRSHGVGTSVELAPYWSEQSGVGGLAILGL